MPKDYFEPCLEFVLAEEGGYINHPSDPGGATYAGVSLRAVVGIKDESGKLDFDLDNDGDVDSEDIKALKDHPVKIASFYRKNYWEAGKCNKMPWPICLAHFDACVNHGVGAAALMLQRAVGVPADGVIGTGTLKAVQPLANVIALLKRCMIERAELYSRLSAKNGGVFLKGWMKRLFDLYGETFRKI